MVWYMHVTCHWLSHSLLVLSFAYNMTWSGAFSLFFCYRTVLVELLLKAVYSIATFCLHLSAALPFLAFEILKMHAIFLSVAMKM